MIKNEKQYKITNKKLTEVIDKINHLKASTDDPLRNQMMIASLDNFKRDLETEVKGYEKLKNNTTAISKERKLEDLPSIIIEYKIAHHLTHKEFAELLGLKEQQLQRYEAEDFKTVSFQNLMKFLSLINLNLKIKETVIKLKRKLRTSAKKNLAKA